MPQVFALSCMLPQEQEVCILSQFPMPHEQPLFPRQFPLPRHPFIVFIIYILSKCFRKYKEYFLVTFNICGGADEVQNSSLAISPENIILKGIM